MMTSAQEYISTTLPMLVNTLMQLVSTVLHSLVNVDNTSDVARQVTLPKFTVSAKHAICTHSRDTLSFAEAKVLNFSLRPKSGK